MNYTLMQFIHHMSQASDDAMKWLRLVQRVSSEREISAYKAGFSQGQNAARNAICMHGGFHFSEPK